MKMGISNSLKKSLSSYSMNENMQDVFEPHSTLWNKLEQSKLATSFGSQSTWLFAVQNKRKLNKHAVRRLLLAREGEASQ